MPLRIVYILTTLGIGGAEKQVISLAEQMAARGHFVTLVSLKHADEEWPVKLPVLRLNFSKTPMGIWRGLRFAQNFLAVVRPEILHSHTFPANMFARMLRILLGLQGKPPLLINTIHNVHEGGWHRMMLYRLTDRWADTVTAVSSAAAERFIRTHAVPERKMTVLTNGIDTDAFVAETRTRKRVRSQMQAGVNFVWIAVGRLVPAKDYPNLLRAFALVVEKQPQSRLWIVGEGDVSSDSELARAIDARPAGAEMFGLRRDVRELLDAADGFVLSSAWEGMPLAVGEAMAMGKPVVATDVGGVRELLGDTGIVVPAADSDALGRGMVSVMTLRDRERIAMGRAGYERVRESFSMNTKVDAWEALYGEWLRGRAI